MDLSVGQYQLKTLPASETTFWNRFISCNGMQCPPDFSLVGKSPVMFPATNVPFPLFGPLLGSISGPLPSPLDTVTVTGTWTLFPDPRTIPTPCTQDHASTIGIENQSLSEDLPVVGTPFSLHYQSDRTAGRLWASQPDAQYAKNEVGGWTLSIHHTFDKVLYRLYFGDGRKRDRVDLGSPFDANASGYTAGTTPYSFASAGGGEVYVFASGLHLTTRHGLTGTTLYAFGYDLQNRLITVTDADGNVTKIERDTNGNPTAIVAPFGQRTTLTLDANGYLASLTDPAGHLYKLTTTATGLLTSYTNPRNTVSRFAYDSAGRLIRDTNAVGGAQTLTRQETATRFAVTRANATGQIITYGVVPVPGAGEGRVITNAAGLKSTSARNASGTETVTMPDGIKSTQTLGVDPRFGQSGAFIKRTTVTTPGGLIYSMSSTRTATLGTPADPYVPTVVRETSTINGRKGISLYNGTSRTRTDISPAGRKLTTTIDSAGRLLTKQWPGLFPITYSYDVSGHLVAISRGSTTAPRIVQLTYDGNGFLAGIVDPLGRTLNYTLDAAGQVTKQTLPDGRAISFSYNANGNTTGIKPPGRPWHFFAYSNVDLPTVYTAPLVGAAPNKTTYTYNLDRQLTQLTRPDGATMTLSYDAAGRLSGRQIARGIQTYAYEPTTGHLSSITTPENIQLTYGYDGSLVTAVDWIGTITGHIGFTYDNDLRVTSHQVNTAAPTDYTYDPDGLLTGAGQLALTYNAANSLLTGSMLGAIQDQWTYNLFGEPTAFQTTFSGAPLRIVQYARDLLGRIVRADETISGQTTQRTYLYDKGGRLAQVTQGSTPLAIYSYDSNGNRLKVRRGAASITATYDAQDRLTQYGTATYTYTANGELQSKTDGANVTNYQYDELGNLMAVTLPTGTQISYLIDGSNRRVGKQINGALAQGFLYEDQLRPLAELDGGGQVLSQFIYATHVNVPEYMVKGGVTYRILTDHLGSPRLVIDVATGTVIQRMDYDEFGRVLTDTNPGFQPFGFAGGMYDRDTGLVRFGSRDYDATTGRWTAKDPALIGGQSANFYTYADNDPVNLLDATGIDAREWITQHIANKVKSWAESQACIGAVCASLDKPEIHVGQTVNIASGDTTVATVTATVSLEIPVLPVDHGPGPAGPDKIMDPTGPILKLTAKIGAKVPRLAKLPFIGKYFSCQKAAEVTVGISPEFVKTMRHSADAAWAVSED